MHRGSAAHTSRYVEPGEGGTILDVKNLIGSWRLVSYESVDSESGERSPLLGPDPMGRLTYTGEGYMHALMMPAGRANYPSGDVFGGSDEEVLAASDHLVAYCGPFDVKDGTIYHRPELSFFPNWVGGEMARKANLEGNRLTLTSHEQVRSGRRSTAVIVWERDR